MGFSFCLGGGGGSTHQSYDKTLPSLGHLEAPSPEFFLFKSSQTVFRPSK